MTRWFTIESGEHRGKRHLVGWSHSAMQLINGWLEYAICPRCFAMVQADKESAYGDQTWTHEQWHANTDFPDTAA